MKTLTSHRTWRALESMPGLAAPSVEWKRLLGAEYDAAKSLLRPNGELASSVPCPVVPGCGCAHAVIAHSLDDIVAVCRCTPRRCETIKLTRADIVIYEVNRSALGLAIATALEARPEEMSIDNVSLTWLIGAYSPSADLRFPLYLTVQIDTDDFRHVVDALIARNDKPFILVAPTHDLCSPQSVELLRRRDSCFIALSEILLWGSDGKFTLTHPVKEILSEFLHGVLPCPEDEYVFRKQGKTWLTVYDGVSKSLMDSSGMAYIAHLLKNPNQEFTAATLRAIVAGEGEAPIPGSAGERLDAQALKEYKERLTDIYEEKKEAKGNNDLARLESLEEERESLLTEIGLATGLDGRTRHAADDSERARQAASIAIHRAYKSIKKENLALWRHLNNCLNIGMFLSYSPEHPPIWKT